MQFGDVSATAYCIQPASDSPGSVVYSISRLKDKKALAKVCYYGTKASGEEGFLRKSTRTSLRGSQDLALVFGEGVTDEKYVEFSVKWMETAKVKVAKVDSHKESVKLAGQCSGSIKTKPARSSSQGCRQMAEAAFSADIPVGFGYTNDREAKVVFSYLCQ